METPRSALSPPDQSQQIRAVILQFLHDRLQLKLDKLKDDQVEARLKLQEEYLPLVWIADAARRVGQIQQVTHAVKYSHPYAQGSSLSSTGNSCASYLEIGTHTLEGMLSLDVVGNAAVLDVYKFLRLIVGGRSLLQLAEERSPDLAAVLSEDADLAESWMAAFAGISEPKGEVASHTLAKQFYWPLENGDYHLLAPLFPTSLVHQVWTGIRQDRFSEEAKAARDAKKQNLPHPHGYREYPELTIQNFGGSKPQNISQLNTERHSENWLLRSTPPNWQSDPISPPLDIENVFSRRFAYRPLVRQRTRALRDFLKRMEKRDSTIDIRNQRAELVGDIRDELFQFAAEIQALEPGWSDLPECRLHAAEKCWLDPGRAASDDAFANQYGRGDWRDEISLRFGNWLNTAITTERTPMGQTESEAWQSVLDAELSMIRLELTDHD